MHLKWGSLPWKIWRPHWKNRDSFGGRRITYAILIALTFLAAIPYTAVNRLANYRDLVAFDPTTQLDIELPFIAWMIIPYLTLYLTNSPLVAVVFG